MNKEQKIEETQEMIDETNRRVELINFFKGKIQNQKLAAMFIITLEDDGTVSFSSNLREQDVLASLHKKVDGKNLIEFIVNEQYNDLCNKYPEIKSALDDLENENQNDLEEVN